MNALRSLFVLSVVSGMVVVSGCGPCEGTLPTPHLPLPSSSHEPAAALRVGVARADITPPPGVSLFGHGPEGRVSDGYWSRQYCRVFVFLPDQKTPLAVVTCDLSAIGTLLQRSVADDAYVKDTLHLPASRLMMTATHTHQGPAHYFEGDFYGSFMSSREPGFDPKMLAFLKARIAAAVKRAAESAVPAQLSARHTTAWGISRNRSLVPFQQNDPPFQLDGSCGDVTPPNGLIDEQRAVDPCLDVIAIRELDAGGQARGFVGSLSFFAMHPTVLPNTTRLLGADVDGVVSRYVERSMRLDWLRFGAAEAARHDPVHAIVNTNEGDMSPAWLSGSVGEAIAIGTRLGKDIVAAAEAATPVPAIVDSRYAEVHFPKGELVVDKSKVLCETPTLGVAMPKGAADHPTGLTLVGAFRDENVDFGSDRPCENPRKPFLDFIQRDLSGEKAFPTDAPLGLVQLGDTLVSFVPAELTITAGQRLNHAVLAAAMQGNLHASRAVVGGLANGYIQYVTTEEEYRLQHYEGASDIYGVWTARFLQERFEALARSMTGADVSSVFGDTVNRVASHPYFYSTVRNRLSTPDAHEPLAAVEGRRPLFVCKLPWETAAACFSWKDGAPGVVPPSNVDQPELTWLSVVDGASGALLRDAYDPRGFLDDRGLSFRTRAIVRSGKGYEWATVVDLSLSGIALPNAVKIRAGAGKDAIESPPFSPATLATCTPWQVIRCGIGE